MYLLTIFRVHVSEQPVGADICFDPPRKRQVAFSGLYIYETCLRLRNCSTCLLERKDIISFRFRSCLVGLNRKLKSVHSCLQRGHRLHSIPFPQRRRSISLVERVSEGEHFSITSNVDVEISIVDVQVVGRLLEVEMRDTVASDIIVANESKLGTRNGRLDQVGGSGLRICLRKR